MPTIVNLTKFDKPLPESAIIEDYNSGVDQVALSKKYSTSKYYILKVLKKNGVQIRSFQQASALRNKEHSRSNSPTYKSGIGIYTKIVYEDQRMEKKCYVCGKCSGRIEIHHIDFNRENNLPENLQVLCKHCHMLRHSTIEPVRDILREQAISMYKKGTSSINIALTLGISTTVTYKFLHDAGIIRSRSEANVVRGYTIRGEKWQPQ